MPTTQEGRLLKLKTPLGEDVLLIKRLRADEGLNRLFHFTLDLLHDHETELGDDPLIVDPQNVLGQPMTLLVKQTDDTERYFNGICVEFNQGNRKGRYTVYSAVVVPAVWLLTQRVQSRIFQQKSVPDILRELLSGFEVDYNSIQGKFEPRNYCVQYRESDFDFMSRLMEEEGMFYYFEHTNGSHKMIIGNTPQGHRVCPGKSRLPFRLIFDKQEEWLPSILTWNTANQLRTGKYTLWDHNFELPTSHLEAEQLSRFNIGGNLNLEHYDYPGEYAKRFDGIDKGGGEQTSELQKVFEDRRRVAEIRQQEIDVAYKNIKGTSDCCALTAGYRFELYNHPAGDNNISHVLMNTQIDAVQSPMYASDDNVSNPYIVNFSCIQHGEGKAPFRPLRKTPKPSIQGPQTAFVVGPAGEEIFTDKYGRVKVQFNWDREGRSDSNSSCWLRVGQMWAGNKWGSMFIPRIGMEVIVNFIDSDPDKPIITGCVYNPEAMPPYTLPDEKTKSTIKTNSSKGGNGFNELRFEDKKGSEQIFIHAEKDMDIRIKNDRKEIVKNDAHCIVENNNFEKVKGDSNLGVIGDKKEKIDGAYSLKVGTNIQEKAGQKFAVDAGQEIHLKSGMTLTLETGTSLTLKVGGNFININSGGIFIKGTMVMINSGGAAGSGSGSSPDAPTDPKEAVTADPGDKTPSRKPAPPVRAFSYSQQALAMQNAANSGTPFCDI